MPPTTRGAKDKKDLPPTVKVFLEKGKPKHLAVAPGMDAGALKAALKHVFKDELKKYDKEYKEYELIGVQLKHTGADDAEYTELVPIDVLARMPAVTSENESVELILSVSPPKPKSDGAPWWAMAFLALVVLFVGRFFLLRSVLRKLYRTGPSFRTHIGTFGFWEGQSLAHICAQLTGAQDVGFWRSNREQCVRIFASREEAFIIAVEVIVLATIAYSFRKEAWDLLKAVPSKLWQLGKSVAEPPLKTAQKKWEATGNEASKWEKEKVKTLSGWAKEQVNKRPWLQALPFLPLAWLVLFYGPISPILQ